MSIAAVSHRSDSPSPPDIPYSQASPPARYFKNTIRCANCNETGHVYRMCNHPITSYGVICFRVHHGVVQYLQVQRRDSLSYVEFLRGKYNHQNRKYIIQLLNNMTNEERARIRTLDFDVLWRELWQIETSCGYQREYQESKSKFQRLISGYYLQNTKAQSAMRFVNLTQLLQDSKSDLAEPEWGWPKGRRNINENDMGCAMREFREETGVRDMHVLRNIKPFEEVFTGTNRVRYRHVYYLAKWTGGDDDNEDLSINPHNLSQVREVRRIKWFDYDHAQSNIREINMERKELFRRVNTMVTRILEQEAGCA